MSTTIKETREAVSAFGGIIVTLIADMADGKVSWMEIAQLASHIGSLKEGISGMNLIPAELADLDDAEKATLLADIEALLVLAGLSHRIADSAEQVLIMAYTLVRGILRIKNAPPVALPA